MKSDILSEFSKDLFRCGLRGEERAARLLYLALTSRFLPKPISVVVKGPSSGGKSFLVEQVLQFFPPSAYYALTAMSERALAYSEEPLSHRMMVIYEAAGMSSDVGSYLMRSLLSEGRIRYELVEKTKDGLKPRLIERQGPTGLLVTTTAVRLHPENETRMLSLTLTDTQEQTRVVLHALAEEDEELTRDVTLERWHALQEWLEGAERRVTIPFARVLASTVPPVAVRLRRDFRCILNLIRAHALLHQASRERDVKGRIIATLSDYSVVRGLVADLVAEGIEATVSYAVRETVMAVAELMEQSSKGSISQAELRKKLQLDKGAVSRRVGTAVDKGYLKNLEDRDRRPARLVLGDSLPEGIEVLPNPERLARYCNVSTMSEGIDTTAPPLQEAEPPLPIAAVDGRDGGDL